MKKYLEPGLQEGGFRRRWDNTTKGGMKELLEKTQDKTYGSPERD